jgi:CRP/FNR family cyclic AMP-dependent transcriptional regulator
VALVTVADALPGVAATWEDRPAVAERGDVRFLDALGEGHAEALRALGRVARYPAGALLFRERDPPDAVFVLQSGRVKLVCVTDTGREAILVIRERGDLIGEMSAIDEVPRLASAIALGPVEVLVLSSQAFVAYLDRTPSVALVIVRLLNRRLRETARERIEFTALDTVGRVCSRLVELADRFGAAGEDGTRIDVSITQEELAAWTASSREAVIRALRTLRELGWIETRRRGITLVEVESLRRRAV